MGEDTTSFWTDIKQYEGVLERDPDSYAFIPLSGLYRKLGLLDDALAVAQRGCSRHPSLVGGQLVLGLACHELGLMGECRAALENVVSITPENIEAQRILSRLYADAGEHAAAESALRILLSLVPNDLESQVIQNALSRTGGEREATPDLAAADDAGASSFGDADAISLGDAYPMDVPFEAGLSQAAFVAGEDGAPTDFGTDIDEDEILDLDDTCIIDDLEEVADDVPDQVLHETVPDQAPLVSATMAELYVKQGFNDLAINVYRQLVAANPMDITLLERLDQLLTAERSAHQVSTGPMQDIPSLDAQQLSVPSPAADAETIAVPHRQETATILEGWLENIRRVKACRSSLH